MKKFKQVLRPMPGFAVLQFSNAELQTDSGIILVQNTRMEIGTLVGIGKPRTFEEAMAYVEIRERHDKGEVFPVRWMAGTCYGDNLPTDAGDMEWLKSLRVYRFGELLVSIPVEKEQP